MLWLLPWLWIYPNNAGSATAPRAPSLAQTLALLDRNLLGLCLGHIAFSYYWYLLVTWLPDYLVEARHMTLQRAAGYAVIPYLVFGASEPIGGWIADRLVSLVQSENRARKLVITAAFSTSVMLLVAGRMTDDTTAVLMIGAASLVGLATGNLYALLASVAPEGAVGTWMGILNCCLLYTSFQDIVGVNIRYDAGEERAIHDFPGEREPGFGQARNRDHTEIGERFTPFGIHGQARVRDHPQQYLLRHVSSVISVPPSGVYPAFG